MSGQWKDKGFQQWTKGQKRSVNIPSLSKGDRVRLQIDIGCSVIDHKCTVSMKQENGAVILTADSKFNQAYRIAADSWIVLNPENGLKRKALVTRL